MSEEIDEKELARRLEEIKEWLLQQPHLPNEMNEHLIRRFLHSCSFSVERTKTAIDNYFTIRSTAPEIFANRDPLSSEIQHVFKITDMVPLPTKTPENYKLFVYRLVDSDVNQFNFNDSVKTFLMLADVRLMEETDFPSGEVPIFDMTNASLRHATRVVFSTLRKYMLYTQEAHPVRLKQIHVINVTPFLDKLFALVKPFMKSEVIKMCHFHLPGSDTLGKFVSKDLLPDEYGGKAGSIVDLKNDWIKRVERQREFFLNDKTWEVDESKRLIPEKVNSSSRGVFNYLRSLSID